MQRRTILKIIALSALSHHVDGWGAMFPPQSEERSAWTAGDYKLQFFTVAENEVVDQAMEIIIPNDAHSGGAHAAKVSLFADWAISTGINVRNVDLFANGNVSSDLQKSEWRSGLQSLKEEAARSSLADALGRAATAEAAPQTDLERFFVTLKQMTVVGYYSSEIGIHQELEYQGNIVFTDFPECTRQLSKLVELRGWRRNPTARL
jgi:Gluconate 2-dehydrogenase subunit 3